MQIKEGKQIIIIFSIVFDMIILLLLIVSANHIFAQETKELHQETLYEIANHTSSNRTYIDVGINPYKILELGNTICVANQGNGLTNGTVSVIDGNTNTKIKDIQVGLNLLAMAFTLGHNTIYIANQGDALTVM